MAFTVNQAHDAHVATSVVYQSEFFKTLDFACHCGCGFQAVNVDFLRKLDTARRFASFPFIVDSGCRCQKYNDSLKNSVSGSQHVLGLAADIRVMNSHDRYVAVRAGLAAGMGGIGIGGTFIHFDDRRDGVEFMWTYK